LQRQNVVVVRSSIRDIRRALELALGSQLTAEAFATPLMRE
jgi:hypothetical protein